jgi:hypothetical protein
MNEMSLNEQIQRLEEMKDYLSDFCKMMANTMDEMHNQIKYLRGEGFSIETEEQYQQRYYTPAKDKIELIIYDIQIHHFRYLDEVIQDLKDAAQC